MKTGRKAFCLPFFNVNIGRENPPPCLPFNKNRQEEPLPLSLTSVPAERALLPFFTVPREARLFSGSDVVGVGMRVSGVGMRGNGADEQ